MGETDISWTHRPGTVGRTWNPVQGCSRISAGCTHCYAERMAARFAEDGWSNGLINLKTRRWNGTVRTAKHKLADPLRWRRSSTVFVNSMSDLFHESLTNEEIAAVFGVMAAAPQHQFQVLTKRAKRMREWFEWFQAEVVAEMDPEDTMAEGRLLQLRAFVDAEFDGDAPSVLMNAFDEMAFDTASKPLQWPLPNAWLGVSVENQDAADERIPELLRTPAAVRFLSCEPLLGAVNLQHLDDDAKGGEWCQVNSLTGAQTDMGRPCHPVGARIDWVIAGCESGPGARPCKVEWLRSLRDQCASSGVAFFLKQAVQPKTDEGLLFDECAIGYGAGSKRKSGGVIELPYLDGVQHAAFPEVK